MKWLAAYSVLLLVTLLWVTGCAATRPGIYSQITIIDLPVGKRPGE